MTSMNEKIEKRSKTQVYNRGNRRLNTGKNHMVGGQKSLETASFVDCVIYKIFRFLLLGIEGLT